MTLLQIHGWSVELRDAELTEGASPCDLTVTIEPSRVVVREPPEGRLMVDQRCIDSATRPYALVQSSREYVLRNFGFFEAHIAADLTNVTCWTDPSVPVEMIPTLVTGNLMNFVMWLHGDIGLHASTVALDGRLLVVMGARNMGKSTTAAALAGAGCQFFGDDLLRVSTQREPVGYRGTTAARLRPGAWTLVEDLGGAFDDVITADGRRNLAFDLCPDSVLPIGTVVVPQLSPEAGAVTLARVTPARAMELYHRLARINGVNDPILVRRYFDAAADLALTVPMFIATIPLRGRPSARLGVELLDALEVNVGVSSPA